MQRRQRVQSQWKLYVSSTSYTNITCHYFVTAAWCIPTRVAPCPLHLLVLAKENQDIKVGTLILYTHLRSLFQTTP